MRLPFFWRRMRWPERVAWLLSSRIADSYEAAVALVKGRR